MENIDVDDEEELLNLRLSIVSTSSISGEAKRKRKQRDTNNLMIRDISDESNTWEGKIYMLLEKREQMLKTLDHDHHDKRSKEEGVVHEDGNKGPHLIHLLLMAVTSIDKNNTHLALQNLTQLYGLVSLTGDSIQRVVSYFADGLASKLLTTKSPFYNMIMKQPSNDEQFLSFTHLYRVSPYYQFAHFTANQAIIEAFEKEEVKNNRALHIIDYDVCYGFQWPSLLQSLSEKVSNGNRISLRITGFGTSLEELQETEKRLVGFTKGFRNLVFEFQGLLRGSKMTNLRKINPNETVAVNLFSHFNSTLNCNNFSNNISDTLKSIRSFDPSIVVLVEQEGSTSCRSFLSTFTESLHYFAAMFDSLDDCLPQDSVERLTIEKNHLGKEIRNMLNYDKYQDMIISSSSSSTCPKIERMLSETWKTRMERNKFEGIKLSSKCMIQAKLLLKIRSHSSSPTPMQFDELEGGGGFRVFERDGSRAICLGWQDRNLLTVSAWHCN